MPSSFELCSATDPTWVDVALSDFDSVLIDHAHCEKKAAASAMSLIAKYPHDAGLVRCCTKLAQEELRHFQQVHAILVQRGLELGYDFGDPYVQQLVQLIRKGTVDHLVDRLLVAAIVERRSHERLALLGDALTDQSLAKFYKTLAISEAGHARVFIELALGHAEEDAVAARLSALLTEEAKIVQQLPIAARIH